MLKKLTIVSVVVLFAASAFADTKNGNANSTSWARYSFTAPADGEFHATVVRTNSNVNVVTILVCGTGAGFIAAQTLSFQDRITHLVLGLPGSLGCALFVRMVTGATAFRLHAQHSADLSLKGAAGPMLLTEGGTNSHHDELANERLRLMRTYSER